MSTVEQRARHAANQRAYKQRHPDRVREIDRAYRTSPTGRRTHLRARDTFRKRHPEATAAHAAVTKAVLRGKLTRLPCQVCGDPRTHAHHHNGYDRQHRLDVTWLCVPHHQEAHR